MSNSPIDGSALEVHRIILCGNWISFP